MRAVRANIAILGAWIRYGRRARRHRYTVNLDAPLLNPTIQGLTLRPVLGQFATKALDEPDSCVRIP